MNSTLLLILNIILIVVECSTLYLFTESFFQAKYNGLWVSISVCILAVADIIVYEISQGILIIKLTCIVIANTVWIRRCFLTDITKSFIASLFFTSFMALFDGVALMGLAVAMSGNTDAVSRNPYIYYLFCYVVKLIELVGIVILRLCIHNKVDSQSATWHEWIKTLIFPVSSVLLSLLLMRINAEAENVAPLVLYASIILVVTDLVAVFLLTYLEQQQQRIHDYSILRRDLQIERDNITAWMNAYNNQRQQTHEYQNQLAILKGLTTEEAPNGNAVRYLDQLLQTDMSASLFIKTGRSVVDVILNQKHSVAQAKGIELRTQLDNLSDFALKDNDLAIVLSNLIDNAIEATEEVIDPEKRVITLKMQVLPNEHLLYIENPTALPVVIKNNHVVSSKKDAMSHGYGLKNIATVLNQYDATYAIEWKAADYKFCFSAQILVSNGEL